MELTQAQKAVPILRVLDEATSTNDELARLAADGAEPHLSTVITLNQTAGRGRLGRSWIAPPGKTLAASVLLRPELRGGRLSADQTGWLPLIAGVAMCQSVDALVGGGRTGLKWPNDVQIDGYKVCGILAELTPSGDVIMGSGVNLTLEESELPVPTATSLALAGVAERDDELVDRVLAGYLGALSTLIDRYVAAGADAAASGIQQLVSQWCRTIGRAVRVSLPGGNDLFGVAVGVDRSGCLLVRADASGEISAVAAGDVTHLRYE